MKISFIVIGRNEGVNLSKCLKAVNSLRHKNRDYFTELIYIDSDSSDDSIEIAKGFNPDKIFCLSGELNAAVARNVGAKKVSGELLIFLDGDVELKPFSFGVLFDKKKQFAYNYLAGFLVDVNYTSTGVYVNSVDRGVSNKGVDRRISTVGGAILVIQKCVWDDFAGMNEAMLVNEDRELSLKMAQKGLFGVRKTEINGLHHTVPYDDNSRMWKRLFRGIDAYKGVVFRKYIFSSNSFYKVIRNEYSQVILFCALLSTFWLPYSMVYYFIVVLLRSFKLNKSLMFSFKQVLYRVISDLIVLFSIFFFYPKKPKYTVNQIL